MKTSVKQGQLSLDARKRGTGSGWPRSRQEARYSCKKYPRSPRGAGRESQMSLARWCHQMGGRTRDALPISYLLLVALGAAVARRRAPPFFFLFPLLSPVEGSVIKFTALTVVQASLAEELAGTTGREVPTHSPPSSLQAPRLSMIGREGGRTRDRNARE